MSLNVAAVCREGDVDKLFIFQQALEGGGDVAAEVVPLETELGVVAHLEVVGGGGKSTSVKFQLSFLKSLLCS